MITDFWLCPFDTWIVYNVSCNKCLSWCTKFCDLVEPTNTTIFNEWKWIHNKSQPHQWQVLFIQKSTKSTFFWTLSDHVMMQPLLFQHKRPFQSWVDENKKKNFNTFSLAYQHVKRLKVIFRHTCTCKLCCLLF